MLTNMKKRITAAILVPTMVLGISVGICSIGASAQTVYNEYENCISNPGEVKETYIVDSTAKATRTVSGIAGIDGITVNYLNTWTTAMTSTMLPVEYPQGRDVTGLKDFWGVVDVYTSTSSTGDKKFYFQHGADKLVGFELGGSSNSNITSPCTLSDAKVKAQEFIQKQIGEDASKYVLDSVDMRKINETRPYRFELTYTNYINGFKSDDTIVIRLDALGNPCYYRAFSQGFYDAADKSGITQEKAAEYIAQNKQTVLGYADRGTGVLVHYEEYQWFNEDDLFVTRDLTSGALVFYSFKLFHPATPEQEYSIKYKRRTVLMKNGKKRAIQIKSIVNGSETITSKKVISKMIKQGRLKFSSSRKSIVKINSKGIMSAQKKGKALIHVSLMGVGRLYGTCVVKVK